MKVNVKRFEYLSRQVVVSELGKKYSVQWAFNGELIEPFETFATIELAVEGAKAEIDAEGPEMEYKRESYMPGEPTGYEHSVLRPWLLDDGVPDEKFIIVIQTPDGDCDEALSGTVFDTLEECEAEIRLVYGLGRRPA